MGFEADPKLQKAAEAAAESAVDFARAQYSAKLDWSDESIERIEEIATHLHDTLPDRLPPEDQIMGLARMLGSYVGETFRRNHGADWGIVSIQGEKFPGLKAQHDGTTFWPWGRVRNRLVNGAEDNIWHYYQVLIEEHAGPPVHESKPWWKRFFA